jgi:hypothetical protein
MDYSANLIQNITSDKFKNLLESPTFNIKDCLEGIGNYSVRNDSIPFNNNNLKINRNCEVFIPKYIVSDKEIKHLQIFFNPNTQFDVPFNFYQKIGLITPKKYLDKYCYNIPWKFLFSKNIPLIALQFCEFKFNISTDEPCQAEMYGEKYFLNDTDRRRLSMESTDMLVKFINSMNNLQLSEGENIIDLSYQHIITGIFLDNIDIDNIESISLYFCDRIRLYYDKMMLQLFLKPINNSNCYYLSFDNQTFDNSNILGGILCSEIDITLKIISNTEQTINIKAFDQNIMRIQSGLCGTLFIRDFHTNEIIHKKITDDNYCAISHDEINTGDKYMSCHTCKKNFQQKAIHNWLKKYKENCPCCREAWSNNVIYINSDN